ncbi:unnamed protein product, partial [Symbiodinium necroappetens]
FGEVPDIHFAGIARAAGPLVLWPERRFPQGFVLAEPLTVCGRRDCDLSELQSYTWTEVTNASRSCWTRDQRGWYYKPEAVTCQTCVYVGDTTTASSTFTETSTTTLTVTVPAAAVWEPVGAPGESACRGRNVNDNLGVYYTVHGSKSIEECKDLCLQHYPRCKGIEYSNNRCEIWTRFHLFGILVRVDPALK